MQQVEVTEIINAPVQAVWNRYTDHVSWSDWAGLGKGRSTPPPNGAGCVRVFSNADLKVVYEEVVSFEPRDGHTLVTRRCQFDSKIPGFGRLFRALVTRMFRNALRGLARTSFSP